MVRTEDRLMSIDALRGFDMFFITGGAALISSLCIAFGCRDGWLCMQMRHATWVGFTHHDTIFPLFLFLAGVSWPFSYGSQLAKGRTMWQVHRKVLLRMLVLTLIGFSFGGILEFNPQFRIPSVLGFIGISWATAAILYIHIRKTWIRIAMSGVVLLGYWAILNFIAAPDAPAGVDSFSREGNIISWLDRKFIPNHIYVKGVYDPETFFTFFNGFALAVFGTCIGDVLKSGRWTPKVKTGIVALSALGFLVADMFFIFVLGDVVVKRLWTSSFVLSAAAYSAAMLAIFYWIIDVRGWRRWSFYFRVIGMNSILIYVMQIIGAIKPVHQFLFGGLIEWSGKPWSSVISWFTYCVIMWLFMYAMYRKKVFLKV